MAFDTDKGANAVELLSKPKFCSPDAKGKPAGVGGRETGCALAPKIVLTSAIVGTTLTGADAVAFANDVVVGVVTLAVAEMAEVETGAATGCGGVLTLTGLTDVGTLAQRVFKINRKNTQLVQ